MDHPANLYDRYFTSWLNKRVDQPVEMEPETAPNQNKEVIRVDVTALQRAAFDPGDLARLDALGYAW